MKNGNRYSFNPRRKIIPQIVAMRTGKFGYTLIVHLASNLIGPNRNYYRIYFDFIPRLIQITRKGNIF